ncbi:Protein-export protein SecB [compost metagenome]
MTAMSEQQPFFNVEKVYLKGLSLEIPHAPQVFTEKEAPKVDINLHHEVRSLDNSFYEVALTVTVTAQLQEKTVFLVEVAQAGIFQIYGVPQREFEGMLNVFCPGVVLPYARETVSATLTRAGFPPVLLPHVNFEAIYQKRLQEQSQAGAAPAPLNT